VSAKNRARVEMRFGDGSTISAWTSLRMRDSFTDPLGQLDFEVAPPRKQIAAYREALGKGQLVAVMVNGVAQGVFIVQARRSRVGRDGVVMSLTCHTPLITPYQASVDPRINFHSQADASVVGVVAEALAPFGFEQLRGDVTANVAALTGQPIGGAALNVLVETLKTQDAQAQDGEAAYDFCRRIFGRLGVALRMRADGTLLLEAPNYNQPAICAVWQTFGTPRPGDAFLADPPVEIEDTNDEQFSECTVRGSRSDSAGSTATATPTTTVFAADLPAGERLYRSTAANYKPLFIKDKNSRDAVRCKAAATRALGLRAARAYVVRGAVDGFISSTGRVWTPNTMVHVTVEAEGLNEDMWLLGREFSQDRSGGQVTALELIPKGALVLGDLPSG
jgi:prophage tail gpP-like protein